MAIRSVRLAYAVPPMLAIFLGVLGILQVDEDGILGTTSVVSAVGESASVSNKDLATRLESVASENKATVARLVADRNAPSMRRLLLVTNAPSSRGAAWLKSGYDDFSRSMSTRVRPISDLFRYDTAGSYQILGDEAARRAVVAVLTSAGFSVQSEQIPVATQLGINNAFADTGALVGSVVLGCAALCLVGTVGAPRRSAICRLNGRSTRAVLLAELSEVRFAAITLSLVAPLVALALWCYNGLASSVFLAQASGILLVLILLPVVATHMAGSVLACRVPIGAAIRGSRPSGPLVFAAQCARVPALLLVVSAMLDLVGSISMAQSGDVDRELRAAGDTVQLWVTPEPRAGVETQEYWDRIGHFAGRSLDNRQALLSAKVEVSTGRQGGTAPALVVDGEYLRRQRLTASTGERIEAKAGSIDVWIPEASSLERRGILDALSSWELRGAPREQRDSLGGGRYRAAPTYTYPGDSTIASWLTEAIIVVVPDPSAVFTADQLGSWISTGDVVFASSGTADRAIARSDVRHEFSAVVAVGQDAAERLRHAVGAVRVAAIAVFAASLVAIFLSAIAIHAHMRRHGRALFARVAMGWGILRANSVLFVIEGILLTLGLLGALNGWWALRPGGGNQLSALDPVARSAAAAGGGAGLVITGLAGVALTVLVSTARRTISNRGRDA